MVSSQKILSVTKAAALREVPRKRIVAEADLSPQNAKVRKKDPKEDLFDKPALLDKMMAEDDLTFLPWTLAKAISTVICNQLRSINESQNN